MVTSAKLKRILDALARGHSIRSVYQDARLNTCTHYDWIARSMAQRRDNDTRAPLGAVDWMGEVLAFDQQVKRARAMSIMSLDSTVREEAEHGVPLRVGKDQVWEQDPLIASHALSMDDDSWTLMYGSRSRSDTFKRDEHGALVPARTPVAATTKNRVLESMMPKLYGSHQTVEIKQDTRFSGSVTFGQAAVDADRIRREQLKIEAAKHLSNPNRTTKPTGPVDKGRPDDEPMVEAQPPRPAYARTPTAQERYNERNRDVKLGERTRAPRIENPRQPPVQRSGLPGMKSV